MASIKNLSKLTANWDHERQLLREIPKIRCKIIRSIKNFLSYIEYRVHKLHPNFQEYSFFSGEKQFIIKDIEDMSRGDEIKLEKYLAQGSSNIMRLRLAHKLAP